jgi:two-component system CheB/CheR fusion protein
VQESDAETAHAPKRILVVEDNEDAAQVLVMLLDHLGHDARAFATGSAALEAAGSFGPDVALIDIGLPGMDGYDLARELRRIRGLGTTRLIAMTGYGHAAARERSREAGFHEHLVKPVSAEALETLVGNARPE